MAPAALSFPPRYIAVSTDAEGTTPGIHSLLAFGACVVGNPDRSFYVELPPILGNHRPAIKGAMTHFQDWVTQVCGGEYQPVFASFEFHARNFIRWYCTDFLGVDIFAGAYLDLSAVLPASRPRLHSGDHALNRALAQEGTIQAMSVKSIIVQS